MNALIPTFFVLLTLSYFSMPAIAALNGAQRKVVYDSTYKSCIASASKAAPHSSQSAKHAWCICYAAQVVDRVDPADIESFASRSGKITPKMSNAASGAISYCRKKLG